MGTLDPKFASVLRAVIEEYVETAKPVGSLDLAQKYKIEASSATIRNHMARLEDEGFLVQPYTSAGRIPTEAGYRYYLETSNANSFALSRDIERRLELLLKRSGIKGLAKAVAEISQDIILIELEPDDLYYTGFSHLFEQPEFSHMSDMTPIGNMIDHVGEMMEKLRNRCSEEMNVFIGNQNPFNEDLSVIMSLSPTPRKSRSRIIGLIGPMRMPYDRNIALMRFVREHLSSLA